MCNSFERHAFEFPSIFHRDIHFNYINFVVFSSLLLILIWTGMNFHFNVVARYQREVFQVVEWNEWMSERESETEKKENKFGECVFEVWVCVCVSVCVYVNYDEIKWSSLCMWRVWTHLSLPTILYEHAFALRNYLKISSFHAVFACALALLMCTAHIHLMICLSTCIGFVMHAKHKSPLNLFLFHDFVSNKNEIAMNSKEKNERIKFELNK